MRVLYIHSREFLYKPREKVKIDIAEEAEPTEKIFHNTLVTFITVEQGDFNRRDEILGAFINDIMDIMQKVKAESVVIYPYAHLSNKLEKPNNAIRLLRMIHRKLEQKGVNSHRAPFGWYKEFKIHCLGHPLAELSRTF
jgi:threonyl-tRNA synthetase